MELLEVHKFQFTSIDVKSDYTGDEFLVTFQPGSELSFSIIMREQHIVHFPTFVSAAMEGFRAVCQDAPREVVFRLGVWKNWVKVRGIFMRKKYKENDILVGPLPADFPDEKLGFKNMGGLFALICKMDAPMDPSNPNITLVSDKYECLDCLSAEKSSAPPPAPDGPNPSGSESRVDNGGVGAEATCKSATGGGGASQFSMGNILHVAQLVSKFL
jgi:hypothetical protein